MNEGMIGTDSEVSDDERDNDQFKQIHKLMFRSHNKTHSLYDGAEMDHSMVSQNADDSQVALNLDPYDTGRQNDLVNTDRKLIA